MLSDSTRRSIRTGFDVLLGVLAVAAIIVPSLSGFGVPTDSVALWMGYVIAATAVISKVRNKLEDLGLIPALLYRSAPTSSSGVSPSESNLS